MGKQDGKNRHVLCDALGGAFAGCVSRIVVNPLDVLKIRFQVQLEPIARAAAGGQVSKYTGMGQALANIVREEGLRGLWRGTVPGLLLTIPYTAVQFVALQQFRDTARRFSSIDERTLSFVSGAAAGAAATVASYPFDLLRTTLAAQGQPPVHRGMLDAARCVTKLYGVRGLYRGLGVTLVEIVPYAALQFGLYDALTAAAARGRARVGGESRAGGGREKLERFLCGLAAGVVAKLGTHPLDVVKKRKQVAGLARSLRYGQRVAPGSVRSVGACLADIARAEGLAGLYKGAAPSLLKAAPAAAVTLSAYEFFVGIACARLLAGSEA